MLKNLMTTIAAPGAEFRGVPFWAWNTKLDKDTLRKQIRVMKDMGMGGFFMHSRVGLNTKYLSDEWFECIKVCIDEAEKLGLYAWLYDEDRWPSGAAGGIVTDDVKLRARALVMSDKILPGTFTIASFAIKLEKEELISYRRLNTPEDALQEGEELAIFACQISEPSSWYNGRTYIDTMNPEAVRKFLEVTHDRYAEEVGEHFGKSVPGIFTDEPHYLQGLFSDEKRSLKPKSYRPDSPFSDSVMPWTDPMPERFLEKYGYNLIEKMPELFFNPAGEEISKTRLDFYNLATELFVNAFSKQTGKWCEEHNLALTGHVLCEDTILNQRIRVGSAMRFYEYMQVPGIDQLTEKRAIYDTPKQCASVARQFGHKWRLSEAYGCTGWDFPFMGHKAIGDWQYALGINIRCLHLSWYSMAAEAKRDYPASIFYQAPWFKEYPVVNDYFARLGAALSEGDEARDLLVVHPIESVWGWKHGMLTDDDERRKEDNTLIDLRNQLLMQNIDFDYGDEDIMERHATIEDGSLRINLAAYKAVLIPQLRTIRKSTLELLSKFNAAGGMVVYLGEAPRYVNGVRSTAAAEAFSKFTQIAVEDFDRVLSPVVRTISLRDRSGKEINSTLSQIRRGEDFQTVFICNTGHALNSCELDMEPLVRDRTDVYPEVEVKLASGANGKVFELDLNTGKIYAVESTLKDGIITFNTSLVKVGSRLFIEGDIQGELSERPAEPTGVTAATLPESGWSVRRDEPNVLVLDKGRCRINNGDWSEKTFFIKLDVMLREYLGKPPRGGAMAQPYVAADRKPEQIIDVDVEYTFDCDVIPTVDVELAIERPELYTIEINGKELEQSDTGYWADPAIRRLKLPASMLNTGKNTLMLHCKYHELLPGLESLFILGDFGVKDDTIIKLPESITFGDWCEQGFPHYAGNFTYVRKVSGIEKQDKPLFIEFGEWRGVALGVSVNGEKSKLIPWPPFQLMLDGLKEGENEIAITVYGHRRNAYGPFYLNESWPDRHGPLQFKGYLQETRRLVPCGIMDTPVLKY